MPSQNFLIGAWFSDLIAQECGQVEGTSTSSNILSVKECFGGPQQEEEMLLSVSAGPEA